MPVTEPRCWSVEPWRRDGFAILRGEKPDHIWIATAIVGGDHPNYPVDVANMQRAVDCVNALKGVPDPAAFVECFKDMLDACEQSVRFEGRFKSLGGVAWMERIIDRARSVRVA